MQTLELQRRLKSLGFNPGPLDGVWGRQTAAAVKAYQLDRRIPGLKYPGTLGPTTIRYLNEEATNTANPILKDPTDYDVPWRLEALKYEGIKEIAGPGTQKDIARWLDVLDAPFEGDETAWCGTAVGAWIAAALPNEPLPNNPWGSINWMKWGRQLTTPAIGAPMIFWRGNPDSWQGHIALYEGERSDAFLVYGGNQNNGVNRTWISKSRLRRGGIRWPSTFGLPKGGRVLVASDGRPLSTNEA